MATDCGLSATTGSDQSFERRIDSRPRVGIFQADWALQIHTVNTALVLTESGFSVDLLLYRVPEYLVEGELDDIEDIRVIRCGEGSYSLAGWVRAAARNSSPSRREAIRGAFLKTAPLRSLWQKCRSIYVSYYPAWLDRETGLTPAPVLNETLEAMRGHRYKALIGVEKAGLVWAGQVAERTRVPYMYHSLELFTREFYGPEISLKKKRLKDAEQRYHKRSYATIVQDKARAEVLFADNRMKPNRVLYVPVSLLGQPRSTRSSFLQERFSIRGDQVVILQFGHMYGERFGVELAHLAQRFPERWTLVMHGQPPKDEQLRQIRAADTNRRVVLSLDKVPAAQLTEVVSSAHVGLALYSSTDWNSRLTAFSSEKVALYLQCGVPVVAFNYPGYEILEQKRCGAVIKSLEEMPAAVERILASWDEFSHNARELFAERYEFRANFRKVVQAIQDLD